MKDLIKKEIMVSVLTIAVFIIIFILYGTGVEQSNFWYVVVCIPVVVFILPLVAFFTDSVVVPIAVGIASVSAVVSADGIIVSIGGVAIAGIVVAAVAIISTIVGSLDKVKFELHKGKVYLSLFIEMIIITGSVSVVIFL